MRSDLYTPKLSRRSFLKALGLAGAAAARAGCGALSSAPAGPEASATEAEAEPFLTP